MHHMDNNEFGYIIEVRIGIHSLALSMVIRDKLLL